MDFDNDGILDMISGSYDPGDIYLFRGLGKGEYSAAEKITDSAGVPLVHHPVELVRYEQSTKDPAANEEKAIQDRVASFGSWPEVVDWDGDGDLDLLIGSFGGEIYLRVNEGERARPSFSPGSVRLEGAGGPLKVNGHAQPVAADWDRDGVWDLVVGSDVGAVQWYRNIGSATAPEFAAAQNLIPAAADVKFLEQKLLPDQIPCQGVRAQICVTDYNGDGWLDLFVGDYSDIKWIRELSEEEQVAKEADEAAMKELAAELQALGYDEAVRDKRQALVEKYVALEEAAKKYYLESRSASFVWLYLRRPPAAQSGKSGDTSAASGAHAAGPTAGSPAERTPRPVEFSTRLELDAADRSRCTLVVESADSGGLAFAGHRCSRPARHSGVVRAEASRGLGV